MEGFDAYVGSTDAALQQRPEVLKAVGVDASVDVLDGVIDHLMRVVGCKPLIGEQVIRIESRTCLNVLADLSLKDMLATAGDDGGADLPTTLKDAHDGDLVFGSGAGDATIADAQVHVAGLAADEGLVSLDLAAVTADLQQRAVLHGETNAVKHEPCRLLSDAERPCNLARGHPIFCRSDEPHSGKPLIQTERGILKDRSDLDRELLAAVFILAFPQPTGGNELHFLATAGRTDNPIRPTLQSKELEAGVRIGKEYNGFLKCLRGFHMFMIGQLCH